MINKLKLLYPSLNDEVLALVLEQAQDFVLDYCNIEEIPNSLNSVLLDMCKQDINKLNAEGFNSESAGGSSISYETDYSQSVYKRLKKHKRVKCL
jgi:hypothetical protein